MTCDSHPLLWKNRDTDPIDQEIALFQGPVYRFVALVNAGDTLNAWAGINAAGFGIVNSTSLNLGPAGDLEEDDGLVMFAALGRCAGVEEFALLLDSLNRKGRVTDANYGVLDSTGMTSIFEAGDTWFARFDAEDEPLGLLLRANYSVTGDPDQRVGHNRRRRARQLVLPALLRDSINARFAARTLARDLGQIGFNPYPLPYEESLGGLPFGFVPSETTICRTKTRAAVAIVGARPGAHASTGMMWVMLGPAEVSIPVPVWAVAESLPELLNGSERSLLCDEALIVHSCLHVPPSCPGALNSFRLAEMYDSFAPVEATVFELVEGARGTWCLSGPSSSQAEDLTRQASKMVEKAYLGFWRYIRWTEDAGPQKRMSELRLAGGAGKARALVSEGSILSSAKAYDVTGREVSPALSGSIGATHRLMLGMKPGVYFLFAEPARAPVRFLVAPGR